ncbi:rod shape-determining protein MreC [Bacillus pseudomycoides]|uniref:Cell shape-determining protein MreC n=1 Tax=Bacillus pseudomycoides TaxID=64104 RepID=A0A2A8H064_9BACI|nr:MULTISPECIES: rod shape-determining protein MreC [Bacillus]AIK40373.1 rod shape-determining protein MreC [Bacillus pseudomycoides]AJI15033.1 rod shape-determining protein MreC [Bacillus pseudomycoides]KFN16435.1 rod shape-determining protein MreC [Bacillus pseudomycoides]MBD5795655.1 rod shape-determining protein MreC [Bacillus pseudomycoides]MBJ8028318.1 rod shape-determining protein MreC [Bacillus cereus group sp. N21]
MPQFFLNKRLIVLLVSIILLVALIGISLKERKNLTWPEQFVKDTVGVVERVFQKPANYVAGFFENVEDVKRTYEENKTLKEKLDKYAELSVKVKDLEKDNAKLRETIDKKDSLRDYKPIQATVIARNPDKWYDLIGIDRGAQQGIQKDMAVMTSKGLVGRVKSVSQFTSTVELLSSLNRTNRISAVVEGQERIFGLIEGYDKEKQSLVFTKIPSDVKVEKDQTVVTSGLSDIFPKGLVIGKIVDVAPDEYGLTQTAYVKPAADLNDVDHIMVTKRVMPSAALEQ